jgi:hypothetical protein
MRRIVQSRHNTAIPVEEQNAEDEVIPVELAGTTKLVPRSSVRWVEAQGDYARLHTGEGNSHLVRIPLSQLEDRWSDAGFVRIHRSFLVALPLVTELRMSASGYVVRVGNGDDAAELPVSRRHTRELKDRLVRAAKQGWRRPPKGRHTRPPAGPSSASGNGSCSRSGATAAGWCVPSPSWRTRPVSVRFWSTSWYESS